MPLNPQLVVYLIDALWTAFALYWLIHAFGNKPAIYRQSTLPLLLYCFFLAALVFLIFSTPQLNIRLLPISLPTQIIGLFLTVAGILFAVYARRTLGSNWSSTATLKQNQELIQTGPYRLVRHPIYSGILLAFLGTIIAIRPNLQALLSFPLFFLTIRLKSLMEEKLLTRHFPDQYSQYKRHVKALIPYLY